MNILPDFLARQVKGGPKFLTSIIQTNNGFENRFIKRPFPLSSYVIENVICNEGQIEEIIAFFRNVQGRGKEFYFKDYFDFKASNQTLIPLGNNNFQLVKQYGLLNRIITNPILGSIKIYVKEEEIEALINYEKGVVNIEAEEAKASFEFYTKVRFDQDELQLSYNNHYIIETLKLVEIC